MPVGHSQSLVYCVTVQIEILEECGPSYQYTGERTTSFSWCKSSVIEFKMLKCIYKPNASSSWELEQFLLLKDSSGWSAIRENYSCKMSGIQIASFISKLLEEGHAHERWKEI